MDIWVPVMVALATGAVAWVGLLINHMLARRDLRAQIKADHELYRELGDEFEKRELKASINARLIRLAEQSMPLGRVALIRQVLYYAAILFGLILWTAGYLVSRDATAKLEEQSPGWDPMPWLTDTPMYGWVISAVGGLVLGWGLPFMFLRGREERQSRLDGMTQGAPGSAGTPPNP